MGTPGLPPQTRSLQFKSFKFGTLNQGSDHNNANRRNIRGYLHRDN